MAGLIAGNQPAASGRPPDRLDDLDRGRRRPDRSPFPALAGAVAFGRGHFDPWERVEFDPGQLCREDLVGAQAVLYWRELLYRFLIELKALIKLESVVTKPCSRSLSERMGIAKIALLPSMSQK